MAEELAPYRYPLSQRIRERLSRLTKARVSFAENFPSSRELDPAQQLLVSESLPRFMAALFGCDSLAGASSVNEIDAPDPDEFVRAAVEAILEKSVKKWLLNMGLGGSERIPSWRLIEQIAPLLESADRLRRAGFGIPRIQIFKANNLAQFANDLDPEKVAVTSIATMAFIEAYVSDLYSHLRPFLELEEDDEAWVHRCIEQTLRPLAQTIPVDAHMKKLSTNRGSSVEKGMIYGLAHGFQLQHVVGKQKSDRLMWSSGSDHGIPAAVVTFGGVPERLFGDIIRAAVEAAPLDRFEKRPRVRVIARLCRKPAYLPFDLETPIIRVPSLKEMRIQATVPEIADDWKHLNQRHGFDLAIAGDSGATPFARLAEAARRAAGIAA
jgi:hypothetical protein